jgi:Fe-S-cluster-containing hydrogenase component 2
MSKKVAKIALSCVACGCCENVCPKTAVRVFRGAYSVVDEEKCVGCGKCAAACPAGVIEIVERKEVTA